MSPDCNIIFNASSKMAPKTIELLIKACCNLPRNRAKAPLVSHLTWTSYSMVVKGQVVM